MNKFFGALLVTSLTMAAYATTQYDGEYVWGVDLHKDGYAAKAYSDRSGSMNPSIGSGWYLKVNENATLGFKDTGKYAGDYSDLGVFTFDENHEILTQTSLNFDANGIAEVSIKAGDQIGFWISTAETGTLYSVTAVQGKYLNVFNGRGTYGPDNLYRRFEYSAGSTKELEVLFGLSAGSSDTPVGQPLPGILATLLIGGVGAGVKLRRARKRA
ncbi:MAG: hypothetical protein PHS41_04890 [Victivallaceae bacterium]|nr:hypothetical protein [Victivallaceae bacterium]